MRRDDAIDRAAPWALAAAVILVYAPTFSAPVFGDDRAFVEGAAIFALPFGSFLRGVLSAGYLAFTGEGTYQPLVTLIHYATHAHPFLYRALGAALHAVNAWLVYRVARTLDGEPKTAALAAAAFALFPAHAETLIVSAYKGNLLAFGFSLAALLCWARALESGSRRFVAAAFGFFALALASKETGVLVPGLLAAYSALFARRRFPDLQRRAGLGFALVAVCYLWWRLEGIEPGAMPVAAHSPSLLFGWYVKTAVWPYDLCRERLAPAGPAWHAGTAIFLAALWASRRSPAVLFGLLSGAAALLPFLHRAQYYMDSPVADRYLYATAAGFALAAAFAARERRETRALLMGLILAGAGVTLRRNLLYRDTHALYEQTVACAPEHFKAWGVLAQSQLRRGDAAAAQVSARRALALNPYYPGGIRMLKESSLALGDLRQARDADLLEKALFPDEPQR